MRSHSFEVDVTKAGDVVISQKGEDGKRNQVLISPDQLSFVIESLNTAADKARALHPEE